ncbi:DUF6307 family protein [Pseudonocardia acaciae]|uniref:DUF6307 family protein n=1 Tax=Pseudonocardia acaciae TaxID=551276 RepID=UPI000A520345|nr:DUF6307 family protein [Pseudonocardia acaciae]
MAANLPEDGHSPRYRQRLERVASVIQEHSNLTEQQSRALAVHVLYTLDHIPERIR